MRAIKHGSVDQSIVVRIVDSTDGTPETGVVAATAGLSLSYRREGGAVVAITPSDLAAVDSAHADGGLKHIGAGYYRLDVADAAFATAASGCLVFGSVTGMVVIAAYHPLVAYDPADAAGLGLSRIDATISSRDTEVAAIKAKTDALPADPASEATVAARATPAQVLTQAEQALVNKKLDRLLAADAPVGTPTAGSILADLLEDDLGQWRYNVNALEQAPAGGGGGTADWTVAEREQIRDALGVTGTKTAATGGQVQAIKAKTDTLGAGTVTFTSPLSSDGKTVTLVRGDDYTAADGRSLDWTNAAGTWPNLTAAAIKFSVQAVPPSSGQSVPVPIFTRTGSVIVASGANQQVRAEPTAADTALLKGGVTYSYDVEATLSSERKVTLATGRVLAVADTTP